MRRNRSLYESVRLEINQLKRAGYLHDIGKITFNDKSLLSLQEYTEENYTEMNQHAVGFIEY